MDNSINFGAKFIRPVNITKYNKNTNTYHQLKANFVEFDSQNDNDIKALSNIAKDWEYGHYVENISYLLKYLKMHPEEQKAISLYGITTQEKDFQNLLEDNILGLVEMNKDKKINSHAKIEHIEIHPNLLFTFFNKPEYNHVGTGMIDALKEIYPDGLIVCSVKGAVPFYSNNGFKMIDSKNRIMKWRRKSK